MRFDKKSIPKKASTSSGFTLIEIIIVLAIIGAIAGVILPNLRLTLESQITASIKDLTEQIRNTYDDTVLTGRVHRMVFDVKTGEFWTEIAPTNFSGRAPAVLSSMEENIFFNDNLKKLVKDLEEENKTQYQRPVPQSAQNSASNAGSNLKHFSLRSLVAAQKEVLYPTEWSQVSDALVMKKKLSSKVAFAKISSEISKKALEYQGKTLDKEPKQTFAYFLPDGSVSALSLQIGVLDENGLVSSIGARYTVNVNPLTGQSQLLEGFQDANFTLPQ